MVGAIGCRKQPPILEVDMATRPRILCRHRGCTRTVAESGFCDRHAGEAVGWHRTSTASSSDRGYGAYWRKLRISILQRDNWLCQVCHVADASEVDHIVPKSLGGSDDADNLQAICRDCHIEKTQKEAKNAQKQQFFSF